MIKSGLISAGLGCIFYGISNVIMDRRFEGTSALTTSTYFSAGVFLTCCIAQLICRMRGDAPAPLNVPWSLMLLMSCLYFCADYLYLNAFSAKAHLMSITILATLVPVVAAVITFVLDMTLPSVRHVISFILAMSAIVVLP